VSLLGAVIAERYGTVIGANVCNQLIALLEHEICKICATPTSTPMSSYIPSTLVTTPTPSSTGDSNLVYSTMLPDCQGEFVGPGRSIYCSCDNMCNDGTQLGDPGACDGYDNFCTDASKLSMISTVRDSLRADSA
jgi:hypothetical protein